MYEWVNSSATTIFFLACPSFQVPVRHRSLQYIPTLHILKLRDIETYLHGMKCKRSVSQLAKYEDKNTTKESTINTKESTINTDAPFPKHQTPTLHATHRTAPHRNTAQCNATQHNTTQHNTTQHNTTQHNTTQHNTTQHNTTQHNTTQHNTTQHNTTQHNTTQHIELERTA